MIRQEHFLVGEMDFIRTFSDSGRYVVRDGVEYSEACDPANTGRTYTEGDLMPVDDSEAQDILNILMGVSE